MGEINDEFQKISEGIYNQNSENQNSENQEATDVDFETVK